MDPQPQFKWQWCNKCQGLAYANGPSVGPCPGGGTHDYTGSANYFLSYGLSGNDPFLQSNWRWCNKCQGLAYAGNVSLGSCPAGGSHDHSGSFNYVVGLVAAAAGSPGFQLDWRWCNKCQGLAYAGNESPGPCPGGGDHDHQGSGDYALILSLIEVNQRDVGGGNIQDDWQWCNKCQCLAFAGNKTPGPCAGGGSHNHIGSIDFYLYYRPAEPGNDYQFDWQWCNKCQALAFAGNQDPGGACPAGGIHDHTGSGNYGVNQGPAIAFTQSEWQWCNKCQCLSWDVNALGPCPAGGAHNHTGSGNYSLGYIAT
jgi:hypothetical protein